VSVEHKVCRFRTVLSFQQDRIIFKINIENTYIQNTLYSQNRMTGSYIYTENHVYWFLVCLYNIVSVCSSCPFQGELTCNVAHSPIPFELSQCKNNKILVCERLEEVFGNGTVMPQPKAFCLFYRKLIIMSWCKWHDNFRYHVSFSVCSGVAGHIL